MHKNSSSLSPRVRSAAPALSGAPALSADPALSVAFQWHLPEVESVEATVDLLDAVSPLGRPVRSWHIVTDPGSPAEIPAWSSGRVTASGRLERRARIRVARHDGPCLVRVRVVDSEGGRFSRLYRFDR